MNWLVSPDPSVPGSRGKQSPGAVRAQAVVMLAPSSPQKSPWGGQRWAVALSTGLETLISLVKGKGWHWFHFRSLPHQNVPSLVSVSPGTGLGVPLWVCWELRGFLSNILAGD